MDAEKIERMSMAEIINTAIINEKMAADNYDRIADECDKVDNVAGSGFFRDQANRERGHFNSLVKCKSKIFHGEDTPAVGEVVRWVTDETQVAPEQIATMSFDDALRTVEERERSAEIFYRQSASMVTNRAVAAFFENLADEEAHHTYLALKLRSQSEIKGLVDAPEYADLGYAG
jgi:rubrerythrin